MILRRTEIIGRPDTCNRLEAGKWSEGRTVFKKVDGEPRFLLVADKRTTWTIRSFTTAAGVEGGQPPLQHLRLGPVTSLGRPGGGTDGMVAIGSKVASVSHVHSVCDCWKSFDQIDM